ncbi:5753_t:CDS:2 [Acaulospora morrowiae]|uniref:5753_t:CDS:1 n=1 Tax=Acaulospora morrowiae TaxID=94023 RepID=A0A9N8VIP1_9GLOM|nr:5753_t:CDS:2 [Acaulospora morrowiae]
MQCTETSKRWFAAILDVTLILAMFLCPALGIAKIELFKESNGEIHFNNIIEHGYVIISLIMPCVVILIATGKCNWGIQTPPDRLRSLLIAWPIFWLGISIAYTVLTINEMGDIPFSCPSDYSYSSTTIRTACQVRAANLISMWILEAISIIFVVAVFANWLPKPRERVPLQRSRNAARLLKTTKNSNEEQIMDIDA